MYSIISKSIASELKAKLNALDKSQAVIEFDMDGTIIDANANFLEVMGYALDEVKGKHHSMFVMPEQKNGVEYKAFWEALNRGEYQSAEYKRLGKGGREVWIRASYNPIMDLNGKPFKVVKYATETTKDKMQAADFSGQLDAISKSQAVIEFNMDGTIIDANANFLGTMGYALEEVKGKHHSMFVMPEQKNSFEYKEFWDALNRGEYQSAEYKRLGKGGREVWIRASYNPIRDLNGKPFKVVKYGTETTGDKMKNADFSGQIAAISKSQAVIEFNMDGTIIGANANFLNAMGYELEEVKGKHHSMFLEPTYMNSLEYRQFWESLNRGEYQTAEYKRLGKGGREVWIRASYNPILDLNGKPFKVVKYATATTKDKMQAADFSGQIAAISKSQAVIEFNMDGTIINANANFLEVMGYALDEVKGKHHHMFVTSEEKNSVEYKEFWVALNRGEFQSAEYRRLGKGGREVWIRASYNPIMDLNGKPFKVVKYAVETTGEKMHAADFSGQMDAISKSQAVIEFNMDGTIINANANFLNTMGYALGEIKGRHHSMFVEPSYKNSVEYQQFWENLNRGEFQVAEYKRFGKQGREVWIQASYNPILDLSGKPFKVVKYATDISHQKMVNVDYAGQISAIDKSQAVISFNLEGIILHANENFLNAMGYTLEEVKGKHHSMFVENAYKASSEYKEFWEALNRGDYRQAEYKRLGKGGREVWIQASYNPILDVNGKPYKIVKYASDITKMVHARAENEKFMKESVSVLTEMSMGNLTKRMEYEYKGESFIDIKKAVNATVDKLIQTIVAIKSATEAVNSAAGEIASGSSDLSMRTEQQASSLEETAASMEEITGTVKQNSQNANSANALSTSASTIADAGGKVVADAVIAMSSIEKSSQKISDIIGVIDEIAFQTNLLALNAAVEAARAGDAGKGFAVVASEVRALAGRSASASKEIKTLINESAGQVKTGAQLVNQAGETLKGIVGSVKQVAGIVSEIASASAQQATGIDEINSAVTQMDEVTQQNAALVEENTAAAQSMLEQAQTLDKLISFFKVDDGTESAAQEPARIASPSPRLAPRVAKPLVKPLRKSAASLNGSGHAPVSLVAGARVGNGKSHDQGWEEF